MFLKKIFVRKVFFLCINSLYIDKKNIFRTENVVFLFFFGKKKVLFRQKDVSLQNETKLTNINYSL